MMERAETPTFREMLAVFGKIGLISFGGPGAQIAILQDEVVDRRQWVDQRTFLAALNLCMLMPGPEAQQLATFLGYRLHGSRGAALSGLLFILPGAAVIYALSWLAAAHGTWPPLAAVFKGLLPVVAALVAHAVWRIGGRVLKTPPAWVLAACAFLALQILDLGFPWVILAAAITGAIGGPRGWFGQAEPGAALPMPSLERPWLYRALVLTAGFAVLWIIPFGLIVAGFGREPFEAIGLFFSKASLITFGGAYAVLPYVAEAAVDQYGWLSSAQMAHGLALAEATPGPLILTTQFVGFFAGWTSALAGKTHLAPLAAATLAAGLTTWMTFLPSFYFIMAGAPLVERLQSLRWAAGALAAVTCAVVGVIATLGVTLGRLAFLPGGRLDLAAVAAGLVALVLLIRWKINTLLLVAGGALFGLARLTLAAS